MAEKKPTPTNTGKPDTPAKTAGTDRKEQDATPKSPTATTAPTAPSPAPTAPAATASPTLSDLVKTYVSRREAYDRSHTTFEKRIAAARMNIDRLQTMLTGLEAKMAALIPPSVRDFINPLAKSLASMFPGTEYEVVGPTGLSSSITIVFAEKGVTEEQKLRGEKCRQITLVTKTDDGNLGVRDFSKDTGNYAPGSIGHAAGLNHPTIQVPPNADMTWFAKYVK